MAYLQSSPKGNPNTEAKDPLRNPIGENLPPNIIDVKSSELMTSIRKVDPVPQGHSHQKHQKHAISVERKVITGKTVEQRPKPLSILSLVTKPVGKKSSHS